MGDGVSQVIMGLVGAAVAGLGVVLAQRGKRGDQLLQQNEQQFQRLLSEVNYWRNLATSTRDEFEGRWSRQIDRCRKITEAASDEIVRLMRTASPANRDHADHTLAEIEDHQIAEHAAQLQEKDHRA